MIARDTDYSNWKAYRYDINFGVNLHYAILFGILATCQVFLMIRQRTKGVRLPRKTAKRYVRTLVPYLIGLLLESIGYIGRVINYYNKEALGPYILQSIFLLIAPAFMAASLYMHVGEVVKVHEAETYFMIPIKWFTKVFVIGDVISILLQSGGGGMQASGSSSFGEKIIIGGLFVQIFFYCGFIITSAAFFIKYYTNSKPVWVKSGFSRDSWVVIMSGLFITSIFILIRSIYRVVEYLEGFDGKLMSKESYLFILDSTMILLGSYFYLSIDITNNLTKIYHAKSHYQEYEMVNTSK